MANRSSGRGSSWSGRELLGVLLILIGALYLLSNLGFFDFTWRVGWPIVLIVIGVFILFNAVGRREPRTSSATVPRDSAQQLELRLTVGAGRFELSGGAMQLVEVSSTHDDIDSSVDRQGTLTRVRLGQEPSWWPFFFHGPTVWQVKAAEDVPSAIQVSAGAGDFTFDLSRLRVVQGSISVGAAQVRLVLPRPTGAVEIRLSTGASSVTIETPPGVEARVTTTGGLMNISGPLETPGFAAATDRVTVAITGGASSIRVH